MTVTLTGWLSAFLLTQLVEAPLYAAFPLRGRPRGRALALGLVPSAVTHPFVWFFWPVVIPDDYWLMVAVAEAFAVAAEALILRALRAPRPLLWAVVVNAASVGVGLLSRYLFDWP